MIELTAEELEDFIETCAKTYGYDLSYLRTSARSGKQVAIRYCVMFVLKLNHGSNGLSLKSINKIVKGSNDHTNVIYGIASIYKRMRNEEEILNYVLDFNKIYQEVIENKIKSLHRK